MHQTTAAIHAIFLALALLVSQSWGYFATPQNDVEPTVQQSDIEPSEEGNTLLEIIAPPAPDKEPQVRTTNHKTPKDNAKVAAFQSPTAPIWTVATKYALPLCSISSYRPRPPCQASGYPHSHGNRGPPLPFV